MAMMALNHGMSPGATDKWKVMQLFHEGLAKSQVRVERIDRVASPGRFARFVQRERELQGLAEDAELDDDEWEVRFFAARDKATLDRLQADGFSDSDCQDLSASNLGVGVPLATHASLAHAKLHGAIPAVGEPPAEERLDRYICVALCPPELLVSQRSAETPPPKPRPDQSPMRLGERPKERKEKQPPREQAARDPRRVFLAYVVCYHLPCVEAAGASASTAAPSVAPSDDGENRPCQANAAEPRADQVLAADQKRLQSRKKTQDYAKLRDPVIKAALEALEKVPPGTANTVLLPSSSEEAEAVVSLYLAGGGGARLQRAPGVDRREALGGVVVQRIENEPLFREYAATECDGSGTQRFREDVVWHGTRLKRTDGEGASLAAKLQSIAENGFDPQRCIKGQHAEGGIWVATTPLSSFGHGCDGLVAFVLCVAKTHFNEWVDATCARVLTRERVLPLYSLVHT